MNWSVRMPANARPLATGSIVGLRVKELMLRQNGATQTETIDEIDRFKGYRKTPTACKQTIEVRRRCRLRRDVRHTLEEEAPSVWGDICMLPSRAEGKSRAYSNMSRAGHVASVVG
ncbi:hypothetical protein CA601_18180 [Paraburkholderia hospita]|nr:hypothetical protein CA601_18180 [Paraburkholderia hospita]